MLFFSHPKQDAILAARQEKGYTGYYQLNLPATSERIRMACTDPITTLCITPTEEGKGPEQFQPLASC